MPVPSAPPLPARAPVLVVGGGPVGLVLSALLSVRGVENLVVERRAGVRRAPAAHVIRRRPMAILDELGVGDAVRRAVSPLALDHIVWCATLGGREIGRLELRSADPATGARGPEVWTNCSQDRLEPILLDHAARRPEARVVLGAECVALDLRSDRVVAQLRRDDGTTSRVEAAWVVAADGAGSPTRRALGIAMEGPGPLARFAMVHLEADLTRWIEKRSGPIFWLSNPESPGTLIVHDPARSHVLMIPHPGEEAGDDLISARVAAALGVPEPFRILSVDAWSPHVQVAARYRQGRALLVGDAAHRFPPTGGLGMNTGIQEAHDLAVRLAAVVHGDADATLLERYEAECRAAALANAQESFENLKRLAEVQQVLGECPDLAALERRIVSLVPEERPALERAIERQRSHFVSDGTLPPSQWSAARATRGAYDR